MEGGGLVSDTERYREALLQAMRGEPMSQEMTIEVWLRVHEIFHRDPDGDLLQCLYDHLSTELGKGLRCSVCGRYGSPDCAEGC